jgi:hypothetical protein
MSSEEDKISTSLIGCSLTQEADALVVEESSSLSSEALTLERDTTERFADPWSSKSSADPRFALRPGDPIEERLLEDVVSGVSEVSSMQYRASFWGVSIVIDLVESSSDESGEVMKVMLIYDW